MNLPPPSGKQYRKFWRREKASKEAPGKRFRAEQVKADAVKDRRKPLVVRYPGQFLKVKKSGGTE